MNDIKKFIMNLPDKDFSLCNSIYPKSINQVENSWIFMIDENNEDKLVITGKLAEDFSGEIIKDGNVEFKIASLTYENAEALRKNVSFTKPKNVLNEQRSLGLGDRLGIAGPGHLQIMEKYDAYPVLAQQSIRELNLTNRSYKDVLDAASFAVFKEGFKRGFGADGDHLKTFADIEYALSLGFTMITLDCSDHIRNDIEDMSETKVNETLKLDEVYNELYLNKSFDIEENIVNFTEIELKRCILTYGKAIDFAVEVYDNYIKNNQNEVNFEISIDETATPTSPTQHFFVASELKRHGVKCDTVAPRFCGEFQKGIDYIGDIQQFEQEMKVHAAIARHFGYKLSIHSGSDKFSIFEIVGKYTKGNFHVKTAGTNWLEAMKVVAICDPKLYREVHKYALSRFEDAKAFYHVTTDINKIPDLDSMQDFELKELFANNDSRQLIHITYGFILSAKDKDGNYQFKDRLFKLWQTEKERYAKELYQHIGKHLCLLYKGFEN
jgi:hypothetical protein